MSSVLRTISRSGTAFAGALLSVLLLLASVAAPIGSATAQTVEGDCFSVRAQRASTSTGSGGWFDDDIELIYVFVADTTSGDPVDELAEVLEERFEVAFVDDVLDVNLGDGERLIVIDDALGVPGTATVFRGERTPSLYLHSSTAAADARRAMNSGCTAIMGTDSSEPASVDTDSAASADAESAVDTESAADAEAEAPQPPTALAAVIEPAESAVASPVSGDHGSSGDHIAARWNLADDDAEVLTGYADDASFDVRLPAGWEVASTATFETDVVASEIGRDDLSLRIDIDDRPVHTWAPGDRSGIDIAIEPPAFAEGGFEIQASTTTPLVSDVDCPDLGHVGRWVDIGLPSVHAEIRPSGLDVARAIASLGPISQLTDEPITVLLAATNAAQQGSPALLEAAGAVAAAVGHYGAPVGWTVEHSTDAAQPALASGSGSVIVIEERVVPARATLSVSGSRPVLTLQGQGEALVELANLMAHPDRLVYFHGSEIEADSIPPASAATSQEVFGFADAGYDDRTLRGYNEKSLVYRLHIPAGVPPDRATLALYGTYSPVLAERGATVSVRINGSEEEIVAVADETGRLEVLHTLTAASLRPGLNFVKVTVDLGEAGAHACTRPPRGWLTVARASGLAVEAADTPEAPELGVEDARFALASTVDFTAADVVIADGTANDDVQQALVVIAELADRADGGAPRLVTDADASTDRHLVVLGPASERELLAEVVPVELGDPVGLVAAIPSPYARGRVLLAMTGGTKSATSLAIDAALSARVNDVTVSRALVGIDRVQPIGGDDLLGGQPAELLPFEEREPGPPVDDYEAWLLAQAARIESAAAPQAEVRRLVAFGLLLSAAVLFGFGWIRRIRQSNTAGSAGGH